ncbi:MAG: SoxR reducing system RseC family protein [Peptococcaceae bacterium]|nr:SoxR reducing system RseC family protein [Peptococcaceae bacterium]
MRQSGVVVSLNDSRATVKVLQRGACGSCRQKCGLAQEIKELCLEVQNPIAAQVGDRVMIDLPDHRVLKAALWVYLWPLLFLFLGVALGMVFLQSEIYALFLGLFGLACSYGVIKMALEPKIRQSNQYTPAITGFSNKEDCKER